MRQGLELARLLHRHDRPSVALDILRRSIPPHLPAVGSSPGLPSDDAAFDTMERRRPMNLCRYLALSVAMLTLAGYYWKVNDTLYEVSGELVIQSWK